MKKHPKENNGGNFITNYIVTNKNEIKKQKMKKLDKLNKDDQFDKDFHDSSKQAQQNSSHTEVIALSQQQQKAHRQQQIAQVCYQMRMIGPCDTTYFAGSQRKLKQISQLYTVQQITKYIAENAKFGGAGNIKNLQKLDDEQFWTKTMPKMIQYVNDTKKQKSISGVPILLPRSNQIIQISKAQILMILINMLFCTLPRQSNRKNINFAQLMYVREDESQSLKSLKLQKLKCIINYFKVMCRKKYKQLQGIKVQIQRSYNGSTAQINSQLNTIQYRMKDVEIKEGLVEDRDGYDILVDFANKNIGGGVLTKGAVQEQILFCIYPELIVTICISYEMLDNEAIVVYNVDRINKYVGYSDTFKFAGSYTEEKGGPFTTTILAVDATNFNNVVYQERAQYTSYYVERELHKMLIGIKATDFSSDAEMGICTGRWGCGVFGGDVYLKFLIQWIACSIANKNMTFMCQEEEQKQLQIMYKFLKKFDSLEILQIIEQYDHYFDVTDKSPQISFLQFIKKHAG